MSASRWSRRQLTVLLLVLVVGVPLIVWATSRTLRRPGPAAPTSLSSDPGVSHVHGLGIDPADGALIVATHFGSFRIPATGGRAVRIGASFQDTMGFTVAGSADFLGSGHPDVEGFHNGQPGRLGLIESTDGGVTWTPLSLSGKADFHGLAYAHDQVYGWDAGTGQFMVSADRRAWDTRSKLDLFGFAVDPADAEHLVGSGPDGLIESNDGGRTWKGSDGPPLVVVSWDVTAGLWGADAAGAVWRRDSSAWSARGTLPGPPEAFLANATALYAAVDDDGSTGIYRSSNGGRTWELMYRDQRRRR